MYSHSGGVEMRVYEACDSLMVVMEELKAPGGHHRGCCEQILWQRWMEFTGQPSTLLYRTLCWGTENFWFQVMERRELSPSRNNSITFVGDDSRDTALVLGGSCPKAPKKIKHTEFKPSYRFLSFFRCECFWQDSCVSSSYEGSH